MNFLKFDDPKLVFDGEYVEAEIKKFIKGNQLPLVSEFTQEVSNFIPYLPLDKTCQKIVIKLTRI